MNIPMRHLYPAPAWLLAACLTGCQTPPVDDANTAAMAADEAAVPAADRLLLASARVALPPAGVRLEDLPEPASGGAQLMQMYCTTCHALPTPAMHSATDWPGVIRRMWLRIDLLDPQYGIPSPELGERLVLLDYLTGNALKVSRANLPDAPGREFFATTCAQCHELPDPKQHSSQDWFVVVRRMNGHMRDILGRELTAAEVDQVTQYLTAVPK